MSVEVANITPGVVAAALAARAEDFVAWLLPNGVRRGTEWCIGSPAGDAGESCKIQLEGEKAGRWCDFADPETRHGDLIDLLAAHRGAGVGAAITEACAWLGIERPKWTGHKPMALPEPERPADSRVLAKAPKVLAWLKSRGISQATAEKYLLFATGTDTLVFPSMVGGKLAHLKFRPVTEKKFWSSKGTAQVLFGWQAIKPSSRAVVITEGEMDALAMMEYGLPALSIPFGAGKGRKLEWIETEWERLERFDTIFVAMDWDRAGLKTVQELVDRLGRTRCRVLRFAGKDANQHLMDGFTRDQMLALIRESKTLDPIELRNAGEFRAEILDRFYPADKQAQGFLMPWAVMSEQFVFGWGETTVLAGYAGHGKSELVGQLVLDANRQGVRACVASLEFRAEKWLHRCGRQALGTPTPDRGAINMAVDWFAENLWAVDVYGTYKIDRILEVFAYANRRYDVRLFVIDNFTKLGIADDDLAGQKRAMNLITEFAVQHNVHVLLVHHLRKEETDFAATNMSKLSLKGSSSIGDLADNIWIVWRNRNKEQKLRDPKFNDLEDDEKDKLQRSLDTLLRCEKYRNGDEEPRLPLWYHKQSHTWIERQGSLPIRYVKVTA